MKHVCLKTYSVMPIKLMKIQSKMRFRFTVWNFHDFSVIQILREINVEELRSCKTAVCVFLGLWIEWILLIW